MEVKDDFVMKGFDRIIGNKVWLQCAYKRKENLILKHMYLKLGLWLFPSIFSLLRFLFFSWFIFPVFYLFLPIYLEFLSNLFSSTFVENFINPVIVFCFQSSVNFTILKKSPYYLSIAVSFRRYFVLSLIPSMVFKLLFFPFFCDLVRFSWQSLSPYVIWFLLLAHIRTRPLKLCYKLLACQLGSAEDFAVGWSGCTLLCRHPAYV